jgi:hypothetical protein
MSGTLGYDDIRAAAVRQVAQLTAAAAITAPKSGQLFPPESPTSWKPSSPTTQPPARSALLGAVIFSP